MTAPSENPEVKEALYELQQYLSDRLAPLMLKPALAKRANVGSCKEPEGRPRRKTRELSIGRKGGEAMRGDAVQLGKIHIDPPVDEFDSALEQVHSADEEQLSALRN